MPFNKNFLLFFITLFCYFPLYAQQQCFVLLCYDDKIEYVSSKEKKHKVELLLNKVSTYSVSSESNNVFYVSKSDNKKILANIELKYGKIFLKTIKDNINIKGQYKFLSLANNGKLLFWGEYHGDKTNLYVLNLYSGSSQRLLGTIPGFLYRPAWSPDSKSIAFYFKSRSQSIGVDDYGIGYVDVSTGEKILIPKKHNTTMTTPRNFPPSWSPDSKIVLFKTDPVNNSPYRVIAFDLKTKKTILFSGGLWKEDDKLLYIDPNKTKLTYYQGSFADIKQNKNLFKYKVGELNDSEWSMATYNSQQNTLFYICGMKLKGYNFNTKQQILNLSITKRPQYIVSIIKYERATRCQNPYCSDTY